MTVKEPPATGEGLIEHWRWAAEKGLVNQNTAGALKAAASQVLSVEGEDWHEIDIRSLDLEDVLDRFERLRGRNFTPQSLATYRSRFKKAVELYLAYLEDPKSWRMPTRERSPRVDRGKATKSAGPPRPTEHRISEGLVEYPFPLRDGVMVRFYLPPDLREGEARRLAAFLSSLAMDRTPALPARTQDN